MPCTPPNFEVLPRDLSAYQRGNSGIDYVHRIDSGKPGPHVPINGHTHGNEFCGMVDREPTAPKPRRRFKLIRTHVIAVENFAFVRPVIGFETFAKDELIATDGPVEVRAPCDDCTIFMPARKAIVGREGVDLTRPLD